MTSGRCWRLRMTNFLIAVIVSGTAAVGVLLTGSTVVRADQSLSLIAKIEVGGKGLGQFSISFVDPKIHLYVLADRTNASVDLVDTTANSFIGRVGGFKGIALDAASAPSDKSSGPDGVVIVGHKEIWAGDGDSTIKVIDIATRQIIDTINTGGKFRTDGMAWDPRQNMLAVVNDADKPPFVTIVDTLVHKVLGHIVFDGSNGTPDATEGLQQPQWSPETGMFYVSIPQVGSDATNGGVAVINPNSMRVVTTYPVEKCSPAGLALGPRRQALIGCSRSFETAPNMISRSIIIGIANGEVETTIAQIGGSGEVWYDHGTSHYYIAASDNVDKTGKDLPILGFIDQRSNTFEGGMATSKTAHSVAAARLTHRVFVPFGFVPADAAPNADPGNPCPRTGCIAVYQPSAIHIERHRDHRNDDATK